MKIDERYIKMFVRVTGQIDGESFTREIPFDKCTDADYAEFLPVSDGSAYLLNELKTNPKRGLWCINMEEADISIFGNELDRNHTRFEIVVLPCNHRLTQLGGKDDRIPQNCIEDQGEQIKYLGSLNMLAYFNQESFLQNEFNELSIYRHSVIENIQADELRANWIYCQMSKNLLSDKTELI